METGLRHMRELVDPIVRFEQPKVGRRVKNMKAKRKARAHRKSVRAQKRHAA